MTWDSSISRTTLLAAGQETAYRFVVICPGTYGIQTLVGAGEADLEVTGPGGTTALTMDNLSGLTHSEMALQPGVYDVRVTAVGSQPAVVQWTLKPLALDYEKIIENGVGQAPALSLSLVGSLSADPTATSGLGAADGVTNAVISGGSAASSVTALVASPVPSSLLLVSMDTGLMGLPGADAQQVAAVGPTVEGALASVADRLNGLMPGIRYTSASDSEWRLGNGDPPENLGSAEGQPAVPQEAAVLAVTAKPETVGAGEDARVLARVDRLLSLVNWFPSGPISSWLGGVSDADHSPRTPESSEILAQSEVPVPARRRKHRSHLIEADLTIPLGVILTSAVAYRVRRPLQKRLGHKAPALEGPRRPHIFYGRGPHARRFHAGTTCHARVPHTPFVP